MATFHKLAYLYTLYHRRLSRAIAHIGGGVNGLQLLFLDKSLLGVGAKFEMSHGSYVECDASILPEAEVTLVGLVDGGIEYP